MRFGHVGKGPERWVQPAAALFALLFAPLLATPAQAQEPIKIGFSTSLSGPLASSGKANTLARQIWAEEINAKGGLLGRPVQLVFYDDQTNAGLVPGIYAKLLDVDKVDLLMGEATNLVVAAMPMIMQRNRMVMTLVALAVNDQFNYPRYFQNAPWGPAAKSVLSEGFFDVAAKLEPKPQTVALVGADAEFPHYVMDGARANAKKHGFRIVFDRTYPPNSTDFSPVVRSMQATNPDLVFVASYPLDSVGMVRATREIGLKPKLFGGAMVGLQYASIRTQLADNLDRVIGYEFWTPSEKMKFPGIEAFLKKYQDRAKAEGADPLGFYQPPFAYAAMQVLEQAVNATKSLDDGKLADYIHKETFKTIVGEIKFNEKGEWAKPQILTVQFQNVQGNGLEQYNKAGTVGVLHPPEYRDAQAQTPFVP